MVRRRVMPRPENGRNRSPSSSSSSDDDSLKDCCYLCLQPGHKADTCLDFLYPVPPRIPGTPYIPTPNPPETDLNPGPEDDDEWDRPPKPFYSLVGCCYYCHCAGHKSYECFSRNFGNGHIEPEGTLSVPAIEPQTPSAPPAPDDFWAASDFWAPSTSWGSGAANDAPQPPRERAPEADNKGGLNGPSEDKKVQN